MAWLAVPAVPPKPRLREIQSAVRVTASTCAVSGAWDELDRADDCDRPDAVAGLAEDRRGERVDADHELLRSGGPAAPAHFLDFAFERGGVRDGALGEARKRLALQLGNDSAPAEGERDLALGRGMEAKLGARAYPDLDRRLGEQRAEGDHAL